jgi:hypothetical protein
VTALENRLLTFGLRFATAAAVLQTAVHLLNALTLEKRALNVNFEDNPFAWASTVATFSVAFVATVRAAGLRNGRVRYVLLASVAAFISLDDMVAIHEDVGTAAADLFGLPQSYDSVLWPAVYFPLLALGLFLLFSLAREAPERPRRFIYAGLALLAAALAAEVLSGPWTGGEEEWPHILEGAFEEAAELAAWILVASALTVMTLRDFLRESG